MDINFIMEDAKNLTVILPVNVTKRRGINNLLAKGLIYL
jgi:hypothetical protein